MRMRLWTQWDQQEGQVSGGEREEQANHRCGFCGRDGRRYWHLRLIDCPGEERTAGSGKGGERRSTSLGPTTGTLADWCCSAGTGNSVKRRLEQGAQGGEPGAMEIPVGWKLEKRLSRTGEGSIGVGSRRNNLVPVLQPPTERCSKCGFLGDGKPHRMAMQCPGWNGLRHSVEEKTGMMELLMSPEGQVGAGLTVGRPPLGLVEMCRRIYSRACGPGPWRSGQR